MPNHALTYSSDLIVRDAGQLASLCVFFDKVYLPFIPDQNADLMLRVTGGGDDRDVDLIDLPDAADYWRRWDESQRAMYDDSVLVRLPPLPEVLDIDDDTVDRIVHDLYPNVSGFSRRAYFLCRVIHHMRLDHPAPQLLDPSLDTPTRAGYKWLLADELFGYQIPALRELPPEEILEVRRRLADTREGFAMHLQKLSRGLQSRIAAGEPFESIRHHARSVIETDIVPDYEEFVRQLAAQRAGFFGNLLDVAAKCIRMFVPAARPDFATCGFATLGAIMSLTRDRRAGQNTNASLAYQFVRKMTSEVQAARKRQSNNSVEDIGAKRAESSR